LGFFKAGLCVSADGVYIQRRFSAAGGGKLMGIALRLRSAAAGSALVLAAGAGL